MIFLLLTQCTVDVKEKADGLLERAGRKPPLVQLYKDRVEVWAGRKEVFHLAFSHERKTGWVKGDTIFINPSFLDRVEEVGLSREEVIKEMVVHEWVHTLCKGYCPEPMAVAVGACYGGSIEGNIKQWAKKGVMPWEGIVVYAIIPFVEGEAPYKPLTPLQPTDNFSDAYRMAKKFLGGMPKEALGGHYYPLLKMLTFSLYKASSLEEVVERFEGKVKHYMGKKGLHPLE